MLAAANIRKELASVSHVVAIERRLSQKLRVLLPVLIVGDGWLLVLMPRAHDFVLVLVDLAGLLVELLINELV